MLICSPADSLHLNCLQQKGSKAIHAIPYSSHHTLDHKNQLILLRPYHLIYQTTVIAIGLERPLNYYYIIWHCCMIYSFGGTSFIGEKNTVIQSHPFYYVIRFTSTGLFTCCYAFIQSHPFRLSFHFQLRYDISKSSNEHV